MSVTTKHLIKLYSEYKKIGQPKGYSDGTSDGQPVLSAPSPEEFQAAASQGFDPSKTSTKSSNVGVPDSSDKSLSKGKSSDEAAKQAAIRRSYGYDENGNQIKAYSQGSDPSDDSDISNDMIDDNKADTKLIADRSNEGLRLPSDIALPKEDEDAEKAVDAKEALKDELDKESPDKKSEDSDRELASEEPSDDEKKDIAQSGFTGKVDDQPIAESNPGSPDALARAQAQRQSSINQANQLQLGNLIGAGIAGRGGAQVTPLPSSYFQNLSAGADLPVKNIEEQIANQKNDPNSNVSKAMKSYLASKRFKVPDNSSAADMEVLVPSLQKDQAYQTAIQKAAMAITSKEKIAGANIQSREGIAADKRKIEQQKADAATESASGNKQVKADAAQDRTLQQTKTMLESARGNPAAAQAEKDMYSVDKVNSLFKIYPDPDKIPEAQVNLVVGEIAKVAQGGVPPGHEMDALKPGTAESKLQSLWGKVVNSPQPANLGAYLNELKKYTDALHGDAQKVIQDKYGRVIESSKKQLGPDNYKALQDQYINRFMPKEQPASAAQTHPQDSQAVAWAKANPGDPRSAKILQLNGGQ
jgi:hypothetical protein